MFGIKRRFQQYMVWPHRFKESSVHMHQIWVPTWKRAVSATVVQSSKRTIADRHRLPARHNKHCGRAFQWYQHRWPWTTLNPKMGVLVIFSRFMAARHISRVNCVEITGGRPRQPANEIFSIKRRFQQCKFRPSPRFKESSVRAHQIWVPLENVRFLLLLTNLAREWLLI